MSVSPFTAVPAAKPARRSAEKVLRARVQIVIGLLLVSALMGVLSTVGWIANVTRGPEAAPPTPLAPARGLAEIAARDFLEGRVINLPKAATYDPSVIANGGVGGGKGVALDYTELHWDRFNTNVVGGQMFERHYFLVTLPQLDTTTQKQSVSASQRPFQLVVSLLRLPGGGSPVLAASPQLGPWLNARKDNEGVGDYSNTPQVSPRAEVVTVVDRWARAYASNNGQELLVVTGDPQNGTYQGLGGFTATKSSILSATLVVLPTDPNNPEATETMMLARVSVNLTRPRGAAGGETFSTVSDFDLLIENPTTGTAYVTSWGSPGSGDTLRNYQNALERQ